MQLGPCDKCAAERARFTCTRCKLTAYCGKQCQLAAWPDHKDGCNAALRRVKHVEMFTCMIDDIFNRVAGNIIAMIVNSPSPQQPCVIVEINETVAELAEPSMLRYVHLRYPDASTSTSSSECPPRYLVRFQSRDLTVYKHVDPEMVKKYSAKVANMAIKTPWSICVQQHTMLKGGKVRVDV